MTASALMAEASARGVRLWRDGQRLRYAGPRAALDAGFLRRLAEAKPMLIAALSASQPSSDNMLESFEERAGILEFDAGMARNEAERKARRMVWGTG